MDKITVVFSCCCCSVVVVVVVFVCCCCCFFVVVFLGGSFFSDVVSEYSPMNYSNLKSSFRWCSFGVSSNLRQRTPNRSSNSTLTYCVWWLISIQFSWRSAGKHTGELFWCQHANCSTKMQSNSILHPCFAPKRLQVNHTTFWWNHRIIEGFFFFFHV